MTSKPIRVNLAGDAEIDPSYIYYTHSKIRPFFSGCGKRIVDTIAEIESGKITAKDLPQITVIQDAEGNTYCMNNRRLYVFKHLRRIGLLEGDAITVRVKKAIPRELAKYNPQNCSLNCTIIREKAAIQLEKDLEEKKKVEEHPDKSDNSDKEVLLEKKVKHDKKSLNHDKPQESDEERYLRQKRRIEEAREQYKKDAAERLRQKQQKSLLLKESSECDDGSESSDDEPEEELFMCNLCGKEFKSVEQIEQHFQSKAHKKHVQESIRKKKERERKAANRELGRQRKLQKEKAAQAASLKASGQEGLQVEVTVDELSLVPPPPPTYETEKAVENADRNSKTSENEGNDRVNESSEIDSKSELDSDIDSEDDDFILLQMASRKCRQGLPEAGSDNDRDSDSD